MKFLNGQQVVIYDKLHRIDTTYYAKFVGIATGYGDDPVYVGQVTSKNGNYYFVTGEHCLTKEEYEELLN